MPDIEEFLKPISDEAPAGYDVRYEVVYDEIRDGRDSNPLADPPKVPDFRAVRKAAEDVLKNQCKHLQIAAWLLEAWIDEEGMPGLVAGIELQTRLLEEFWDTLFPEIDEGDLEYRVAPLEWVAGKYLGPTLQMVPLTLSGLTIIEFQQSRSVGYEADLDGDYEKTQERNAEIEGGKMAPEEFDKAVDESPKAFYKKLMADMAAALAAIDRLEALTDERFGNLGPSFRPLRGSVDELQRVVRPILEKKLEADPDPVEVEPIEDLSSVSDGAGDVGGLTLDPVSKDDAGRRIAAAAKFLRQADPHDPASYLMVRGFRWGELRKGGGTVEPRMLAAPPTQIRTQLKSLLLDQKWPELLETAEGIMASPYGRGWLDLQRYIFTAIDGLGPDYEVVRGAMKGALRSLLIDLPTLVDLTLMDDTSTANRETQVWLGEEGLLGPLTEEEMERREGGAAAPVIGRDVAERARERVRAGQPEKAIEMLMQAADQEPSVRGRSLRRAEAAAVMVDHGLAPVAMPLLRDIMAQIEGHQLEGWEAPETIAVMMATLYRCIDRMGGDESEKQELYLRVCRLDPMQAIHFAKQDEPDEAEGGEGELQDA